MVCDKNLGYRINSLVLHRVLSGRPELFEDISLDTLIYILSIPGITFSSIDAAFSSQHDGDVVCLTFDDGFLSDRDLVFPLLKEKGIKATFYIVTDWIDKPGFLTSVKIREMSDAGMQIGSHSVTHRNFLTLSYETQKQELLKSRLKLEDLLGKKVTSFSFPYGAENSAAIDLVFQEGYTSSCVSRHGILSMKADVFPRNSINGAMSTQSVQRIVEANRMIRTQWKIEDKGKQVFKKLSPNLYRQFKALLFNNE